MDAGSSDVGTLLGRMRAGDREAAAEFITRFGGRIRRRARRRLGSVTRRVYDSEEVVSTVARRLDRMVGAGSLRASSPEELWSLLLTICENAAAEKARQVMRQRRNDELRRHDEKGGEAVAEASEVPVAAAVDGEGGPLESERDRQIVSLWMRGMSLASIASYLGEPSGTIRRRWDTIKKLLREHDGGEPGS